MQALAFDFSDEDSDFETADTVQIQRFETPVSASDRDTDVSTPSYTSSDTID